MKRLYTILFIVLIALLVFSRFYKLNKIQPNLNMDEVAMGWNAYSILKTGHDEWGNFLPLTFRSVGDYKPPILIYMMSTSIAVFGRTEWAVRFPGAVFSVLSVLLIYYLARKHFFEDKGPWHALVTAFIAALSPWYIFYSRWGYEMVVMVFFVVANVIYLLRYLKKQTLGNFWGIFLTGIMAAITYNPAKMFIPLFDLFMLWPHLPKFFKFISQQFGKNRRLFLFSLFIMSILTLIFIKTHLFGPGANRAKMVFLTQDYEYFKLLVPKARETLLGGFATLFVFVTFWFKRYLEYFSLNFYSSTGLEMTLLMSPGLGIIHLIEVPFFFLGLFLVVRKWREPLNRLLLGWLFIGLLPASLSNNSQSSIRSVLIFPAVCLILTIAFVWSYQKIKFKKLFLGVIFLGYLISLIRFADFYLIHYPIQLSEYKGYGWKQITEYALTNADKYDTVYVDPRFGTQGPINVGVPHLYFLFMSGYDPKAYYTSSEVQAGRSNFRNFRFEYIDWYAIDHSKNNLYIGSPWSFPNSLKPSQIKDKVYFLNGQLGLMAVSDR